ncbi:MAG: hypothetical protein CMG00_08985 [Candidatus Marinimicrobia bacterium]|nr:hypothetical protein [Candidatus Neomarinimicrobiota bacterium]
MWPVFALLFLITSFFFSCTKLFLSSYIKNPLKYMHLQIRYFGVKVLISGSFVCFLCIYNEDLKKELIIAGLLNFIVCHFIEGFVFQKKITNGNS